MLVREVKLKLTKAQEAELGEWLWRLTGVYNWGLRRIEQDAANSIHHLRPMFRNLLAGHSKKIGIPSHTLQGTLAQAWMAWDRCFKKLAKKPRLKSNRNKFNSIPFPDPIPASRIKGNRINVPGVGSLRFFKQDIPDGTIKCARIVRRASGWYLQLSINTTHAFKVDNTDSRVGIDTGFNHLAVLSDGTKIENQRNYLKSQTRLGQAQRGKNRKLVARLHERIKNQRKDYNHKVSRRIVESHAEIYFTNDNLKGQAKAFGKSIQDAGISQLRRFTDYKSKNCGRTFVLVDSKNSTRTCSECGRLDGPTGLAGLSVRNWVCACGAHHDRDINAARVTLKTGAGYALVPDKGAIQCLA